MLYHTSLLIESKKEVVAITTFAANNNMPETTGVAAWQKLGLDADSLITNPMFEDPEHYNVRLNPCSPADRIGFRPFYPADVGPRISMGNSRGTP